MELLKYLCCPKCKGELVSKKGFLSCQACNKGYPMKKGITDFIDQKDLSSHQLGQVDYFDHCQVMTTGEYRLEPWHKSYIRRFQDNFKNIKNKVILDCGCGEGYMSIELARAGAKIITCDLLPQCLIRLKREADKNGLSERMIFVRCSVEELPLKNKTVDFTVLNAILEHLEGEKETIGEIDRVNKKTSGLMITAPLFYRYLIPLFIPSCFIQDKKIGHLRRYDEKDLVKKFKGFGYQLKKVYFVGHFRKVMVTMLFSQLLKIDKFAEKCEQWERKKENIKYGAANVCAIFRREQEK